MAKIDLSMMWKNSMNDVYASTIPAFLKEKGLYDGTKFPNDKDACSTTQLSAAFTPMYTQGKLTAAFAAALSRAQSANIAEGFGGYGVNEENNTIAEWIDNTIYVTNLIGKQGEVVCLAYDSKNGQYYVNSGIGTVDVTKLGFAPFFFLYWGLFCQRVPEFDAAFNEYCAIPDNDASRTETKQKLACKMAGTAYDIMMTATDIVFNTPNNSTVRRMSDAQIKSKKYAPSTIRGTFKKMSFTGVSKTKVPTFRSTAKFVGAFADENRVLTEEEKAGARAIAAGLGLPYTFITCNAGTEIYNFIGEMMPVDSSNSADSINEELFKGLPTATDISMDPAAAYEVITGTPKPDATEVECMTEMFRKQLKLCTDACSNGFKYVESPLVRAIRNGWVCELQEPSLITRPSVMPGLNGLLDETGCVVLPTGEMLHRHPDCIIISTLNIDLEGCRPLNQSFIDRHHIIMDMTAPTDAAIEARIRGMTGCDDTVPLRTMITCMKQVAKTCERNGATDGNINSMRSLANWVQAGSLTGDYSKAAEWTIVSGATTDPDTRKQLLQDVANYQF